MTPYKRDFLSLMRLALGSTEGGHVPCGEVDWEEVFKVAEQHHVLPMITDAAYRTYGNDVPWEHLVHYKKRAQRLVYLQTVKTERFLSVYRYLSGQGMTPLLIKGLICRSLYPYPDFRFSADEDLLIPPNQALRYHEALLSYGLKSDSSNQAASSEPETPYRSDDGVLFLEVHRHTFPPDSPAYGEYDRFFAGASDRAVTVSVSGTDFLTMSPTDHLLYLICHALKHFLHGGFGIRQVCDIGLLARAYVGEIDWRGLKEKIESIRARDFAASLFAIAKDALGIDLTGMPEEFFSGDGDHEALLEDILESGVYGSSTLSRKHSATITLRAAENRGLESSERRSFWTRTVFLPACRLEKRYPYLAKHPWLLPVAWTQRIWHYLKTRDAANTPGEALRIGKERILLMKSYGLLDDLSVKQVETGEYLTALCELIRQGHEVSIPVAGGSMTPFLGDGRDQVYARAPWRPVRRGDIVLYRRKNGAYVLHRVYRVHGSGEEAAFDLIGDAQDKIERNIQRKQIFAVVTRARRKGKLIEPGGFYWWFFQFIWIRLVPVRSLLMRLYTARNRKQ